MTQPVRTCVGCGRRDPQAALRRFVLRDGALVLDGARRATGRGAYLHATPACGGAFVQRRGAVRSLRATPDRAARERLTAALAASA